MPSVHCMNWQWLHDMVTVLVAQNTPPPTWHLKRRLPSSTSPFFLFSPLSTDHARTLNRTIPLHQLYSRLLLLSLPPHPIYCLHLPHPSVVLPLSPHCTTLVPWVPLTLTPVQPTAAHTSSATLRGAAPSLKTRQTASNTQPMPVLSTSTLHQHPPHTAMHKTSRVARISARTTDHAHHHPATSHHRPHHYKELLADGGRPTRQSSQCLRA